MSEVVELLCTFWPQACRGLLLQMIPNTSKWCQNTLLKAIASVREIKVPQSNSKFFSECIGKDRTIVCATFPTGQEIDELEIKIDHGQYFLPQESFAFTVWCLLIEGHTDRYKNSIERAFAFLECLILGIKEEFSGGSWLTYVGYRLTKPSRTQ